MSIYYRQKYTWYQTILDKNDQFIAIDKKNSSVCMVSNLLPWPYANLNNTGRFMKKILRDRELLRDNLIGIVQLRSVKFKLWEYDTLFFSYNMYSIKKISVNTWRYKIGWRKEKKHHRVTCVIYHVRRMRLYIGSKFCCDTNKIQMAWSHK